MVKHYRTSLLAASLAQASALAHAYEHSSNDPMAKVYSDNAIEDFKKIAFELGFSVEELSPTTLRAAA